MKRSTRRSMVLAALLVPALLVATACSSSDSGSGTTTPTTAAATTSAAPTETSAAASETAGSSDTAGSGAATPIDCKVQASGPLQFYTDKAAWQPDFEAMNDKSNADCGLSINFTGYSDSAQYDAFIKQGFQTDQKPTLFTWHTGDQLKELVDQGYIAETTDLWKAAEANGDVPPGLIDNYTYNGKQYCVPLLVAYWV